MLINLDTLKTILNGIFIKINTIKSDLNGIFIKINTIESEVDNSINTIKSEIDNSINDSVADWGQNDESAPDFVKNRTHYESEILVDILPETVINFTVYNKNDIPARNGEAYVFDNFGIYGKLTKGDEYILTIDGISHRMVATSYGVLRVQNQSLTPAVIEGQQGCTFIFVDSVGPHTIRIQHVSSTLVQLDEKYIPDTIARVEYVQSYVDEAIENLDITSLATEDYVNDAIANLVNSAPDALNTLDELAAALGDDENFATTVTNQIATKADAEHTHDYNDLENKTHYIDKELNLDKSGQYTVTKQIYVDLGYPDVIVCTCDGVEYTLNEKWVGGTGYWGYDEFQAGTSPVYFESNATGDAQSINVVDDGKAHEVVYSTYYATNVYVPLDERFIPDTIARVSDITAPRNELILNSSTEGSTKQFKITIDDTGTLTVSEIV